MQAQSDYEMVPQMHQDNITFEDLRSTFIEFVGAMPLVYNNETVLRTYESMFALMDKLEEKYT